MDNTVLVPSIALGILTIIIYCIRCYRSGKEFAIQVMINAVFQCSGIVCGLFLIVGSVIPEVKAMLQGIEIYIFVSGLAVIAVSIQGVYKDVFKATRK